MEAFIIGCVRLSNAEAMFELLMRIAFVLSVNIFWPSRIMFVK